MTLAQTKEIILKKIDHEFVLPLSIIDTSVQMEKLDSKESEFLDVISCAKMALLIAYKNIKYLLSESSDEKTAINLNDFITRKIKKLTPDVKAYGVSFSFADNNIEYKIYIDESKLDILIDNILSICAKYSNQNNIIKASICQNSNHTISLTIKTKGKKAEAMAESFLNFKDDINKDDGIGLGIFVCRLICNESDALINIMQQEDETVVEICFLGDKV